MEQQTTEQVAQTTLEQQQHDQMEVLEQAMLLLKAVWDGISQDYKSKYRPRKGDPEGAWGQLQHAAAKAALTTNNLSRCISRLCGTFDGAVLAPYGPDAQKVEQLLRAPQEQQQAILRALREQTAVCVLLLRNRKQELFVNLTGE